MGLSNKGTIYRSIGTITEFRQLVRKTRKKERKKVPYLIQL